MYYGSTELDLETIFSNSSAVTPFCLGNSKVMTEFSHAHQQVLVTGFFPQECVLIHRAEEAS